MILCQQTLVHNHNYHPVLCSAVLVRWGPVEVAAVLRKILESPAAVEAVAVAGQPAELAAVALHGGASEMRLESSCC